jgi:chaperone modulatory protein CbpM
MPTHLITLTFQECSTRYGLDASDLRTFVDFGLLEAAAAPDSVTVEEPDVLLPRLARLHHELGLSPEAVDIILAMRRRLEHLQTALRYETARNRQLENFVRGNGPMLEW